MVYQRMEVQRKELLSFINIHAHKAIINKNNRQVHIAKFSEKGIPLNVELDIWTQDEIVNYFDMDNHTTRWVIHQLQTYNPEREIVIGLEFQNKTLLTHVICLQKEED